MMKSQLNEATKKLLLDKENTDKLGILAKKFGVRSGSLVVNIGRDSRHLSEPVYTKIIREVFGLPKKYELTEDIIDHEAFLSKHN
jgi:hypothetical protein